MPSDLIAYEHKYWTIFTVEIKQQEILYTKKALVYESWQGMSERLDFLKEHILYFNIIFSVVKLVWLGMFSREI